jgi:hypothetical protein
MARLLPLAAVIALGLLSRLVRTGLPVFDKYAGDALYAIMIFLFLPHLPLRRRAPLALAIVFAIETFQLTGIPATLAVSHHPLLRLSSRLLGTTFAWLDLLAYCAGIALVTLAIHIRNSRIR